MNSDVDGHRKRIDAVFELAEGIDLTNLELRSHMARYLCVLVSGFVERSVSHIIDDYARRRSAPEVYRFVSLQLKSFQNASTNKILKMITNFDDSWAKQFAKDIEGEIKDSVDSVVATRHQIAHGGNTGITLARMKDYYKGARDLVDLLGLLFS